MQGSYRHIACLLRWPFMLALGLVLFLSTQRLQAQNTKGDRPAGTNKETRQTRFKTKSRQGDKAKTKDITGRKLRTKNKSSANSANVSYPKPRTATKSPRQGREKAGEAFRPVYSNKPRDDQRNERASTPAKRVQVRSASANTSRRNIYPQQGTRSISAQSSSRNIYTGRSNRFTNNPSAKPRDPQGISGSTPKRRVQVRSTTARSSKQNVYSSRTYRYVNNPSRKPKDTQRASVRTASGQRVKVRSISSQVKKQNSNSKQGGTFKNYRSPVIQKPASNKTELARLQKLGSRPLSSAGKRTTVTPRSASKSFIRNKSLNPFAGFFRVERKEGQVTGKDIAGRTLRTRNYQSPPQPILEPSAEDPYRGRKRTGDRVYKGPAAGTYKSASRLQPKAWIGDVAGRKVRGRNYESKKISSNAPIYPPRLTQPKTGDHPRNKRLPNSGFKSYTATGKVGNALPAKAPGKNTGQLGQYQSKLSGRKPQSGGGSISGRIWNNNGQPIINRQPGIGAKNINYAGNMKVGKPLKGGGSVSGKVWNNNGQPIINRQPGIGAKNINYAGNMKADKPLKGGGSISGKVWNNNGQPIINRQPGIGVKNINYTGNIPASKPVKGGGSISGKQWNNNNLPIATRVPSDAAKQAGLFRGDAKRHATITIMSNQGEEFTGFIKRGKYQRSPYQHADANLKKEQKNAASAGGLHIEMKQPGWARNKNAHEDALLKKDPGSNVFKTGGLQVRVQSPGYKQNPNANQAAAMKRKPSKESLLVDNLTVKMNQPGWVQNKNAHKDALLKKDPGSNVFKTDGLQVRVQSPGYKQNPNAHDASIMKRKQSKESFLIDNLTVKMKQPGWVQNKNAHKDALLKKDPGSNVFKTDGLQVRVQSPGYKQNPNAHDASIMKRKQSKESFLIDNLTIKMKQPGWARNKNAHEDALLKRDPSQSVFATQNIYGKIRAYEYIRNPSSSQAALKVREPGKAFAKAANYQGNIKMQKFNFLKHPDYHPDAYFVKINKNNVKDERDLLTNIRLLWAKVFRKNETQPENIKEKVHKPRYDRREVGLWYD